MKSSFVTLAAIVQIGAGALAYGADQPLPTTAADRAWSAVRTFGRPEVRQSVKSGVATATARASEAAKWRLQADQLNAFYTNYPAHPAVKEAKWRELSALNRAALDGDATQEARRLRLLEEIRSEPALMESRRFEAVAFSYQVAIARRLAVDRPSYLQSQESATRALIAEFPRVEYGDASLLAIARDSAPAHGEIVARELIAMADAPAPMKQEAQGVVGRFGLLGQSIDSIFARAGASSILASRQNYVTAIYTWSSAAPQSLRVLRQWASHTPQVRFIGICLDTDVQRAAHMAANTAPSGEQHYDAHGPDGALARALCVGRAPVLYLVDRMGIIRDVQGTDGYSAKVEALLE